MTSRSFPHSKPDVRLSPHPAFQEQSTLLQKGRPDEMSLCPRDAPRKPRCVALDMSAFPGEVCWFLFRCNGGRSAPRTVVMSLFPGGPSPCPVRYRPALGYYAASDIRPARGHSDACWPGWTPGTGNAVSDFPHSARTDGRTFSCLLHAGWVGDNTSGVRRPDALHRTFWSR